MWPNPQETADLVTFTEEILKGKLHFCAVKETVTHVFSGEFCKIFKNTYFEEHLRTNASIINTSRLLQRRQIKFKVEGPIKTKRCQEIHYTRIPTKIWNIGATMVILITLGLNTSKIKKTSMTFFLWLRTC